LLRFQAASGGECGCAGDLTAPSLSVGAQNLTVAPGTVAQVCVTPADMNADRTFNISYQEANAQRASLLVRGLILGLELGLGFTAGAWPEPRRVQYSPPVCVRSSSPAPSMYYNTGSLVLPCASALHVVC
jgi:hypothetical protein